MVAMIRDRRDEGGRPGDVAGAPVETRGKRRTGQKEGCEGLLTKGSQHWKVTARPEWRQQLHSRFFSVRQQITGLWIVSGTRVF